jgi:hypothetical protein
MRRSFLWLIPLIAVAACSASSETGSEVGLAGQTYRDSAGWAVTVPRGWHAVPFTDSKDGIVSSGVQLSNVPLPPPSLVPGFPIQVNDRVLPDRGIGLIIATDNDPRLSHGTVTALPLPSPDGGTDRWVVGSSLLRRGARVSSPHIEVLWFRIGGTDFIASAKIGGAADGPQFKAFGQAIRSLRLQSAGADRGHRRPDRGTVSGTFIAMGGPAPTHGRPMLVARLPGRIIAIGITGRRVQVRAGGNGAFRLSLPLGSYRLIGYSPHVTVGHNEMKCGASNRDRSISFCRFLTFGQSCSCAALKIRCRSRRTPCSRARQSMASHSSTPSGPFTVTGA